MANKTPFFLTGANAKIRLNGRTVAFATDISYNIKVDHAAPRVLGRFEVETHQPLTYEVSGSFTIIRYAKDIADLLGAPDDVSTRGNGIGAYSLHSGVDGTVGGALGLPAASGQFDGRANDSFVPSRMFQSKMFDIEIFQKVPGASPDNDLGTAIGNFFSNPLGTLARAANGNVLEALSNGPDGLCQVAKLEDCRITGSSFTLSKKAVARQRFDFVCRYAHEDTFFARKSGVGQELS